MKRLLSWLYSPLQLLVSLPQWIARLSLPGRIAACVAVFQVLVVLLAAAWIWSDINEVREAWWRPGRLAFLLVLLLLTPTLVYQAARLWLERDECRFPDILEAWSQAVAELRRQGFAPADLPLFLVLGTASDADEKRLLAAAPCEFAVTAAPRGDAALHVFGGKDGVFVSLATCSRLSDLVRRGPRDRATAPGDTGYVPSAHPATDDLRGTVMVSSVGRPQPGISPAPLVGEPRGVPITTTIDISRVPRAGEPAFNLLRQPAAFNAADRDHMRERMAYLCSLLRRERAGLASLNGVLAVLPGAELLSGELDPQALGQALGDDLATLLATCGVKCPVVTVVLGLEREPGFVELIQRMPADERTGRLGHRFPAGAVASYDQIGTLASRACGMVEDLVMGRLFRASDILSTSGNEKLAALLIRLRSTLAERLGKVLRRALLAADGETSELAPFVAGCYLAACGASDRERGFVRGVIDRLLECEGDLEWLSREAEADDRASRTAVGLWIFAGLVLLAVAAAALAWQHVMK